MPEMFIRSAVLSAVTHGFTTRHGGVSPKPYDSLNLGKKWGDAPENVATNLRRLCEGAGVVKIHVAKQVHGAHVHVATGEDVSVVEADALITLTPGVCIGVSIADCVPILLYDPATGMVGAAHAGWRGTVARIAFATAKEMQRLGAKQLVAALGPSICGKCFEVGPEVAAQFGVNGRYVDLHAANAAQLTQAGVTQVEAAPCCTFHQPEQCFSYRRDNGVTGSHLAFIQRAP